MFCGRLSLACVPPRQRVKAVVHYCSASERKKTLTRLLGTHEFISSVYRKPIACVGASHHICVFMCTYYVVGQVCIHVHLLSRENINRGSCICKKHHAHAPPRWDKYEKNVREYWVTEQESGSFETTDEQTLRDTTVVAENAETNQLDLAPPPSGPLSAPAHTSDEEQSMSEDEESGRPKKKAKKEKTPEFDQERSLEAIHGCCPAYPIHFDCAIDR